MVAQSSSPAARDGERERQREAVGEHAGAGTASLIVVEQSVTPLERRAQRLLASGYGAATGSRSSGSRWASDSRSMLTPSSRTRAAASSIASGMPSSWPADRATVSTLASVSAKRRSRGGGARNEQRHRPSSALRRSRAGPEQRLEAVHLLAGDAERHLACHDEADVGPRPHVRGQPGDRVDQMLRVVQNDQQLALRKAAAARRSDRRRRAARRAHLASAGSPAPGPRRRRAPPRRSRAGRGRQERPREHRLADPAWTRPVTTPERATVRRARAGRPRGRSGCWRALSSAGGRRLRGGTPPERQHELVAAAGMVAMARARAPCAGC